MNFKTYLALIGLGCSIHASAADFMVYIGAGGEPSGQETTQFDGTIKNISRYIKKNPTVKIDLALNGGHKKTEELIKTSFPTATSKSNFKESDYDRLINDYKAKLENNEMVAGDQMLIYIDSHGLKNTDGLKSHVIETAQDGSAGVSLDRLEVLKALAKTKGVKMAIIDNSCHSGNTLALADDSTCVITSTGPDHYAYNVFSNIFSDAMEKGKNLEEIFLKTRSLDSSPGLPMISSFEGQAVTAQFYEKITPYLYYTDVKDDKLTPFLQENQSEVKCIANFDALMETMAGVEELNSVTKMILWWETKEKKVDLTKFKRYVGEYQKSMLKTLAQMKSLETERLNRKETFRAPLQIQSYTWRQLLDTDFKQHILDAEVRLSKEGQPSKRELLKDLISIYSQANVKKEELLRTQPDLKNIPALEQEILKSIKSNQFIATAIGTEERKLYSVLYNTAKEKAPPSTANPCRDFKL